MFDGSATGQHRRLLPQWRERWHRHHHAPGQTRRQWRYLCQKKVKVTQSGWPDYVFHEDYKLPALKDLAAFIRKNKHLPGIPSADEVSRNGIDLGEVNKEQVKKIEELTLYIMEQDDKYMKLEKRLELMETKLGNMEKAQH
ncbi:hypothetical protein [Chitinophaga sp. XS-30]|uniref:hypothetical protein n=1 Tax=Chitinophaga sp. XS-30 TaxID=2604421 RepID=UPI0011DC7613|nr:hypothetical protein [Chitinophaga sp. XS-30]QEH42148.1 hypothetical protein FW415_15225 [Chitinophaga sp. XS-30]